MWTKPYGMKEGFIIGGGLIFAGLMLQLSVGPVNWDAFHWPVNGFVMAGFLALSAIIYLLRKKVYGFQFIGTYKAAIPALVYAVVLTIIMGLTRQESLTPGLRLYGCHSRADHPPTHSQFSIFNFQFEKGHPFSLKPSRIIPRHDNGHTRQCRHAATEDDCGEGRARVARTDFAAADCDNALCCWTEGFYHGNLWWRFA